MTKSRSLGLIGVVWGGGILLGRFLSASTPSAGAYGGGQAAGLVFAGLLLIVGAYYLFKKPAAK